VVTGHGRRWRAALGAVLVIGILGGVALAALAGARRTAASYSEYLRASNASDVLVNTPLPGLERPEAVARLPGVVASANYVGLYGNPVLRGEENTEFGLTGLFGSVDGRYFTQDVATADEGRLPRLDATDEIALTDRMVELFGVGLGDELTYVYRDFEEEDQPEVGRGTYRVVGIVRLPPVLVDDADDLDGALLPPAATEQFLETAYYSWQGVRLEDGADGIDAFISELATDPATSEIPPIIKRVDETSAKVQRALRPLAVSLALFGAAVGVAALVLAVQALARLISPWGPELASFRAMGATRGQRATFAVVEAVVAAVAGTALAVGVAAMLSPLAPIGSVREVVPSTGFRFDGLVLGGGGVLLLVVLLLASAALSWRTVVIAATPPVRRPSRLAARLSGLGLPVAPAVGTSQALEAPPGRVISPLRATLVGGVVAMTAVVAAVVFGGNLRHLVDTPAEYGWDWDEYLVSQDGYGALLPDVVRGVLDDERGVEAWSLLAFGNGVPVDDLELPVLALQRERGDLGPPAIDGRLPAADGEIAVGTGTLQRLGKHVGDTVRMGEGPSAADLRIVGTVVLPAIGQVNSDHTALGRGALVTLDTFEAIDSPDAACMESEDAVCPVAVALRMAPGADGDAVAARITAAQPDGQPRGTLPKPVQVAAEIRNAEEMGVLPLALGSAMALGAVLSLGLALTGFVRQRRRELAILKTVGFTRGQVRSAVVWQGALALLVALAVGVPLGVAGGRWLWTRFASDIGVAPEAAVPGLLLLAAVGVVLLVGVLSATAPGAMAAGTRPADAMRAD
jgi:ABC-type lipoprotein release transport system permease subunit